MVFRNLAFYRYPDYVPESQRLKDVGYELIPELPAEYHWVGDTPNNILELMVIIMGLYTMVGNTRGRVKPHAMNLYMRF